MQQVRSVKNQYLGINAHLHSYWQAQGGWSEFHTSQIVDLTRALKEILLPLGYTAGIEQSLQVRRVNDGIRRPTSDVLIYKDNPQIFRESAVAYHTDRQSDKRELTLTLPDMLQAEEDDLSESEYRAIALYEVQARQDGGSPVAWIELLSPSNKPGGRDAESYRVKRRILLEKGIVLVEIDYLHESSPTISQIPRYRIRRRQQWAETGAHPYHIIVIDPRPHIDMGTVQIYQFDVDESLPIVTIPLQGSDQIKFDFGPSYDRTLKELFFHFERVDYRQLPMHFDRYSQDDQQRIAARMIAVLEAAQNGIDLESGPFPTQAITHEDALAYIEAYSA